MLSDEEKRDLKSMAHDPKLREDFNRLRDLSIKRGQQCPIDVYVSFLTCLHQLPTHQRPAQAFPLYSNVRL